MSTHNKPGYVIMSLKRDITRQRLAEEEKLLYCVVSFHPIFNFLNKVPNKTQLVCGQEFVCRSKLIQHMHSHTDTKPYACQYCSRKFTSKGNCKEHEYRHLQQGGLKRLQKLDSKFYSDFFKQSFRLITSFSKL